MAKQDGGRIKINLELEKIDQKWLQVFTYFDDHMQFLDESMSRIHSLVANPNAIDDGVHYRTPAKAKSSLNSRARPSAQQQFYTAQAPAAASRLAANGKLRSSGKVVDEEQLIENGEAKENDSKLANGNHTNGHVYSSPHVISNNGDVEMESPTKSPAKGKTSATKKDKPQVPAPPSGEKEPLRATRRTTRATMMNKADLAPQEIPVYQQTKKKSTSADEKAASVKEESPEQKPQQTKRVTRTTMAAANELLATGLIPNQKQQPARQAVGKKKTRATLIEAVLEPESEKDNKNDVSMQSEYASAGEDLEEGGSQGNKQQQQAEKSKIPSKTSAPAAAADTTAKNVPGHTLRMKSISADNKIYTPLKSASLLTTPLKSSSVSATPPTKMLRTGSGAFGRKVFTPTASSAMGSARAQTYLNGGSASKMSAGRSGLVSRTIMTRQMSASSLKSVPGGTCTDGGPGIATTGGQGVRAISRIASSKLTDSAVKRQRSEEEQRRLAAAANAERETRAKEARDKAIAERAAKAKQRREAFEKKAAEQRVVQEREKESKRLAEEERKREHERRVREIEERNRTEIKARAERDLARQKEATQRQAHEEEERQRKMEKLRAEELEAKRKRAEEAERERQEAARVRAAIAQHNSSLQNKAGATATAASNYLHKYVKPSTEGSGTLNKQQTSATRLLQASENTASGSALKSTYVKPKLLANLQQQHEANSYAMTPPPKKYDPNNYDISDLKSDDESDDADRPKRPIPRWARGGGGPNGLFQNSIKTQFSKKSYKVVEQECSDIFGAVKLPIELGEIFPGKEVHPRYQKRTSSAIWTEPPDISLNMSAIPDQSMLQPH